MKKAGGVLLVAVAGVGLLLLVLYVRKPAPVAAPPSPPVSLKPPGPPLQVAPSPGGSAAVPPKRLSRDPLLQRWQTAIRQRNSKEVLELQAAFLAKEDEYREALMKLGLDEQEPRVRAFSVAVLGRMNIPPSESYFLERLNDAEEYPRTSSCQALERIGTAACLERLDRAAEGDSAAAVRAGAARAAKAVRSR
jgi:hypothetical protein